MKRSIFILLIMLFLFTQVQLFGQDEERYAIAASSENTVLLDTQSGETWILTKKSGAAQPYEWVKIKTAFKPEVKAGDWSSIVQGQNQPVVKADRSAMTLQYKKDLRVTQQKIDQLKADIKDIEQTEQAKMEEMAEQLAGEAKEESEKAKELWKKAIQLLKEIQERQEKAVEAMTRM